MQGEERKERGVYRCVLGGGFVGLSVNSSIWTGVVESCVGGGEVVDPPPIPPPPYKSHRPLNVCSLTSDGERNH